MADLLWPAGKDLTVAVAVAVAVAGESRTRLGRQQGDAAKAASRIDAAWSDLSSPGRRQQT